jgi:hypothetical protein
MAFDGEPSQVGDDDLTGATALDASLRDSGAMLGVHVVTDPDPAAAAQRMADDDDVEVVADRAHAETAFAARAGAGRTAVVVIGDRERAELEAAAAAPRRPAVTSETLAEIRQLADELRRIERIRQRTEDRFTETLNERLADGSGLALHPDTLRAAATAVVDVEAEVEQIEAELDELSDPVDASPTASAAVEPARTRRRSHGRTGARIAAVGLAVVAIGIAIGTVAVGRPPAIAAVVAVVGLIVAIVLWVGRRSHHDDDVAARLDDLTNAPPPRRTPVEQQNRMITLARLETTLERAQERQRSAQRHWESLAGQDANAHDIDAVLRMRDPQYVVGTAAARASPTMRTVNAVHRRALARWQLAWAGVGFDDAPNLAETEGVLRGLTAGPATDPGTAQAKLAAADAWAAAGATIDRTLVLVEPSKWLPAADLAALMGTLPAGAEVIVVQRG